MLLVLALLAIRLSPTLGVYTIQNHGTEGYVFVDARTRHDNVASVFVASRADIEESPTRHMYFDLRPVDDAYLIVNPATQLALYSSLDHSAFTLLGVTVKAGDMDETDDVALFYLTVSSVHPHPITNKHTSEHMFAYKASLWEKFPSAMMVRSKSYSLLGSSLWVVKEVDFRE